MPSAFASWYLFKAQTLLLSNTYWKFAFSFSAINIQSQSLFFIMFFNAKNTFYKRALYKNKYVCKYVINRQLTIIKQKWNDIRSNCHAFVWHCCQSKAILLAIFTGTVVLQQQVLLQQEERSHVTMSRIIKELLKQLWVNILWSWDETLAGLCYRKFISKNQ